MQWSYGTTFSGGPPGMDEPLESDRPDFTESPVTVGKGVVQLETGYDFFLNHAGNDLQTTHSFPDTLWRIGMFADWFEWRIEYNYEIVDDTFSNGRLAADSPARQRQRRFARRLQTLPNAARRNSARNGHHSRHQCSLRQPEHDRRVGNAQLHLGIQLGTEQNC